MTSSPASWGGGDGVRASRHQARPQRPSGHGCSGKRNQNSSALPGSGPPGSRPVLCVQPHAMGIRTPLDSSGNHSHPPRPHWGFSHISAALAAAAFYRPRNGSEMGSNLPGRSARICLIPRPSSSPQHQGTHSKVLTSDDTPMEHFTSMSLHSWPEILLAAHWQTSTHP